MLRIIDGMSVLDSMALEKRIRFKKGIARWEKMTPAERQQLRMRANKK